MRYEWVTTLREHEDPDSIIRKTCHLGPHLLEMVESHWDKSILMMAFNVYKWNHQDHEWEQLDTDLKEKEYNRKKSHTILEDWYACNVLLEDHFGREDEGVQSK